MSQTNSSPKRNLDQLRACDALRQIESLLPKDRENYESEAKRLPVRIMASGLGQAMAFVNAKVKRDGLKKLNDDLTEWVIKIRATDVFGKEWVEEFCTKPGTRPTKEPGTVRAKQLNVGSESKQAEYSLLHSIIQADSDFLRWATSETLAYLVWLNRFSEAKQAEAKLAESQSQTKGD